MVTGFICDERYFWMELAPSVPLGRFDQPMPPWDSPEGKRRILNLIRASGLLDQLVQLEPFQARDEDLLRFHTPEYVARVKALSDGEGGSVGEVTSIPAGGFDFAQLAVGGCIAAMDAVLRGEVDNAYAFVRPAGHHAEADHGRGFCVFANTALSILWARAKLGLRRVAVIDWDVHHGNGTQAAFWRDGEALTISIHQDRHFPRDSGLMDEIGEDEGRGANLNIPLPPGSGHGAYLDTIERVVVPALEAFEPELVVIASGFDANAFDPLGRMLCTSETYREMTLRIKAAAERLCGGKLVVCQEGGYSPAYMPYCALAVAEALSGIRTQVEDTRGQSLAFMGGQDLQPHQAETIGLAVARLAEIPRA